MQYNKCTVALMCAFFSSSDVGEGVLMILKDKPSGSVMTVEYNQSGAYYTFPPEQCPRDISEVITKMQP